jgi:hypothetical protein
MKKSKCRSPGFEKKFFDNWVFMDTLTLLRMSDKKITRHVPLKLDMSPCIDREYFHCRYMKLLVNRRFGISRKVRQELKPKPATVKQTVAYPRREPYEGKLSRTVLVRERRSNPPYPADYRETPLENPPCPQAAPSFPPPVFLVTPY